MAVIRAAQNGNWSATSSWTGGVVPTTIDDAVSNNFNIVMDVNTTVLSLRNDTSGSATAGGQFQFSNAGVSVTLTGATPLFQGGTTTACILANNTTGTVNIITTSSILLGSSVGSMITHTGAGAFTLTTPLLTNNGGSVPAVLARSGTGTLTIIGNVSSGTSTSATNQTINNTGTGTIVVNGSVTGGNSSANCIAIFNTNTGATINVNGNVFGGGVVGAGNQAINSSGPVNITAGSVTAQAAAIAISCSNTVTVQGTVTSNGSGAAISAVAAATSITVTGNVIVGTAGTGNAIVSTNAGASVTLIGNFTNTAGRQAIYCQTIYLSNAVTNQLTYNTPGGSSRTLYSDDTFPNLPSTANVRFGTTYGPGSASTGTLRVPSPSAVLLGNLTDNTTGTLLMTPADFVSELNTSSTAVAVRLRNCATVATTGDQVASYGA